MEQNENGGIGALIGIIIIIALIVIGGFYFWGQQKEKQNLEENTVNENEQANVSDLEAELEQATVDIDSDIANIDSELQGSAE